MSLAQILLAFIFGSLSAGFMLVHPIGPALILLAVTPFDAIFFNIFGWVGNAVTYPPVVLMLLKNQPSVWGRMFFGSKIQATAAAFILVLAISHLVSTSYYGSDMLIEYAKKMTLLILLGVFAYSMRTTETLELSIKTLVVSMTLFVLLNMIDFYLGIRILPTGSGEVDGVGLIDVEFETYLTNSFRFKAPGLPINRFSNWLLMPAILSVGWLFATRTLRARVIAATCVIVLALGQAAILSRGGFIAFAAGLTILLPTVFRFRVQTVAGLALIAGAILFVGSQASSSLGVDQAFGTRFDAQNVAAASVGRLDRVKAGLQVFATSPVIGVGDSHFTAISEQYLELKRGGRGSHNAYLQVLAESGIIGFIPFMMLLFMTGQRLLYDDRRLPDAFNRWRPYFLAAFASQLVHNMVHDYQFERMFWINIAFAAAMEQAAFFYAAQRPNADSGAFDPSSLTESQPPARGSSFA